MKKTLYLMRHGQTQFNALGKIQGWCDSPLTQEGIKQAQNARKYFQEKNISFDAAYSSTAERASDTLEIVTNHKMPYTRVKDLREMNFGRFEGESEALNPNRTLFEEYFVEYGGESRTMVRKRVVPAICEIMARENHDTVFIVSHAGACLQFLTSVTEPKDTHWPAFSNCGMIHYSYEDGKFAVEEVIAPNKKP